MRNLVLIAAMVLASASAQAGESRSLSAYPVGNDQPAATASQPATTLRADNTTVPAAQPAETPRYSAPAAEPTTTPPPAETPHYTARPAAVDTTPPPAAKTTSSQPPADATDDRPARGRHARAERGHSHGRWSAGRIIATLHRYGVYW